MLRRIFDSPWFYFAAAGVLLVLAILSQFRIRPPAWPAGSVDEIATLSERDDLNVVFIVIDTLRSDRLSAYGYERETSPVIDALAAKGIRFAHVESQSSWTKASMASMWTGMYPERTRVQLFGHALPAQATLPAEIMRDAGFRTAGIWRNGWVANNFGFDQGFQLYVRPVANKDPDRVKRHNPSAHALLGTDQDASESAKEFLQGVGDDRFFLYIHYMDVHQYLYADISPDFGTGFSDIYDSSIYWVDRNVGFVIGALEELDMMRNTVVVIASDHGEAFFEHGLEGHARNLYREVLEVPFILLLPFHLEPGIVVEQRVANIDIWPTVLDLIGLPPLPGAEGRSLMPLVYAAADGRTSIAPDPAVVEELSNRTVYAQLDQSWGRVGQEPNPWIATVDGPYRMIQSQRFPDQRELYDRSTDPAERHNVAPEQPEVVQRLRAGLEEFFDKPRTQWEEAPTVEVSEMRQAQLRALGYQFDSRKKDAQLEPTTDR